MVRLINCVLLEGHCGIVWCVSWNHSGKTLASCGEDRTIKLWTEKDEKWQCSRVIETSHEKTIRSIKWAPCDSLIATCGFDGRISVWKDGEECATIIEGYGFEFKSVDWSPDGLFLASCCRDKTVWIWERVADDEFQTISTIRQHTQDVKKVKWAPSSQELFSVSYDNSVKSYSYSPGIDDWSCNFSAVKHTNTVWSIDFNEDGQKMATCSSDKTLRIWSKKGEEGAEPPQWECSQCISEQHNLPIYDVSWCNKSDSIATACGDNAIRIFGRGEADAYESQWVLADAHIQDVNCVTWNPKNGGLLASCSDDGLIKLWFFSF